jgi:hypothetical protein
MLTKFYRAYKTQMYFCHVNTLWKGGFEKSIFEDYVIREWFEKDIVADVKKKKKILFFYINSKKISNKI